MMFLYNRNNIIYNITRYNNFNRTICYCNKNNDIPPNPKDPPHADEIATGCANVFCNGGGMARPGDKMRGKGAIFGRLTKSCYNVYIPNKGLL